jgi:tetrahydromethanopterin S-methyltransferase subunit G
MAESDIDRLSWVILDEFKRVHERLDEHDGRFDDIDADLSSQRATLKAIHSELDELGSEVENITGYRKEIDHALERIGKVEKKIAA